MLIVGEKINSVISSVKKIVKERDEEALQKLALGQIEQGAQVLDINVDDVEKADIETSRGNMRWAINTIQEITDVPLMIDSASPEVLIAGLEAYDFSKNEQEIPFLNSLNAENREKVLPLILNYNVRLIVLVDMRANKTAEEKAESAKEIRDYLQAKGVSLEKIYIDLAVSSVVFNPQGALRVTEAIKPVKEDLGLKTICAPSNVSFGAPVSRKLLNAAFIRILEKTGMDAVIANPKDVTSEISEEAFRVAKEVLEGKDRRLKNYRRYLEARKEK